MSLDFLQLFHVKLGSLHRTLNLNLYLIHRVDWSNSLNLDRIQVLSYSKYSLLFLPVVEIEPATSRWFHSEAFVNQMPYPSSLHRDISTDILDPLSPPFSIVHCFRQVFRATSHISTELLYVGFNWSSCLCLSMWRCPQEYLTYEFVPTPPAVSRMSGLSNFDSFRDGW